MPSFFQMSLIDLSLERGSVRFPLIGSYTGPQVTALKAGTVALSDMALKEENLIAQTIQANPTPAGYRERKLLVRAHDPVTGERWNFSIPGYAGTPLLPDSDFLDPAGVNYLSFKTAFEAVVAGPISGNLLDLDSIEVTRGKK